MKKYITLYLVVLLTLVSLGFYTISKTVVFPTVFSNYSLTINFLERISGVFIFTLLFIQIMLGAYMKKLSPKFGGWIDKVHATQGPIIYILAVIHPFFLLIFNFKVFHTVDPFYIYTQVCFLCKNKFELLYTFGRLGIWFLTIGIFAALFKNSDKWMKTNWKKLHIVNYFVFFFVAVHGYFLGSDFKIFPLNYLFYASVITIFSTILLKLVKKI